MHADSVKVVLPSESRHRFTWALVMSGITNKTALIFMEDIDLRRDDSDGPACGVHRPAPATGIRLGATICGCAVLDPPTLARACAGFTNKSVAPVINAAATLAIMIARDVVTAHDQWVAERETTS